jgi:hypothetical protein
MRISTTFRTIIASAAFALLFMSSSYAGQTFTPILFLGGGNQLICIANNVSGAPLTVRVKIVGINSDGQQVCALPASDRDGCQAFLNGQSGHCRIFVNNLTNAQVRERVRGVMFARTTSPPFTIGPVVQAE